MTWLSTMFHQGGPTMYWIEYLGIAGLVVVGVYLFTSQPWGRWATLAAIVLVAAAGVYGTMQGRKLTDEAVEVMGTPPADIDTSRVMKNSELDELRAQGYAEAMRPIELAAIVGGALVALFAIAELRRRRATAG